jgi:hypothetical protein
MLNRVKCATCGDPNGFILSKPRTNVTKNTCFSCEWKVGVKAGHKLVAMLGK